MNQDRPKQNRLWNPAFSAAMLVAVFSLVGNVLGYWVISSQRDMSRQILTASVSIDVSEETHDGIDYLLILPRPKLRTVQQLTSLDVEVSGDRKSITVRDVEQLVCSTTGDAVRGRWPLLIPKDVVSDDCTIWQKTTAGNQLVATVKGGRVHVE
jgi:hypothetical protein